MHDPKLVERVARALHREWRQPHAPFLIWDAESEGMRDYFLRLARAALSAVADVLRAEGAEQIAEPDSGWLDPIEAQELHQRGRVEGARQVLAAVEGTFSVTQPTTSPYRAAREAVAHIEQARE